MPLLRDEAKERMREGGETAGRGRPQQGMQNSTQPIQVNAPNELNGKVRDIAGKALGVSGFTVQQAATIKAADPEEFERQLRGEIRAAWKRPSAAGNFKTIRRRSACLWTPVALLRPARPRTRQRSLCRSFVAPRRSRFRSLSGILQSLEGPYLALALGLRSAH